ncbi:esterase-like activity of phytase family protein [Massilia sp. CCM 8734]|uniref:esterase-like activity of phytase family protein n=1 Tax=Massilia sp. CCM 8734 TaxID=2609283 RepID=UPI001421157D|nr:esterase-like activity of phytase family protein [Massilia sp. CCM 8734]NHZ99919.1 esterase-like activity of phytase family protein [Massilia sp. CCM 8734]
MKFLPQLSLIAAAAAMAMAGCGGSSDTVRTAPAAQTGVFLDSAVEGLDYAAGAGARATTNAKGEFSCIVGETVAFSIGGMALGSASCGTLLTPLSLSGGTDVTDPKVVNRLLALQLLDDDNDPSNGIKLGADAKAALAGKNLDVNAAAPVFNAALAGSLAGSTYGERTIDDDRRMLAREHFEDTLAATVGTPAVEQFTQSTPLGKVATSVTRYQVRAAASFHVPYEGANAAVKAEFAQGFLPSYGSGLAFKGKNANGDLEFYSLTDRGPNGDGPNLPALDGQGTMGSKIFPSPSFTPSIGVFTIGKQGATLSASLPIKVAAGVNASGLPVPAGSLGNSAEIPVFDAMKFDPASKAVFNAGGIDSEAIAVDQRRNALWVSDEYGPFLARIDVGTGIIQAKYAPGSGLPAILAKRRANRGMEGMTLDPASDKIHAFLQSPLSDGTAVYAVTGKNEQVERFARFTRWIEFDPATGATTRMFAYPLDGKDYADGRTGNAKLGDMVALGNGKFIVIEQGAGPDGEVFNKLMLVQIGEASNILAPGFNPHTSDLEKSSMSGTAINGASWAGVTPLKKTLLLDLNAIGWLAEKAEGLALVDGMTLALTNDNDFGMLTRVTGPDGKIVAAADVTKCNVNAAGNIIASSAAGCGEANRIRVGRGADKERPSRLWLIKFDKALSSY